MKRACSWSGDMTPGLRLVPLLVVLLSLCGLAAAVDAHGAGCPSNGNLHAVYVTTNMGNNILSFDTQGAYLGEVINMSSFPADVVVDKLRAMRMGPGGYLYVTSARGSLSRIFALSGNGVMNHTMGASCTRDYQFTVAMQDAQNPYLDHPYDMVFHPTLPELYVANQNSVTVTKYVLDVNASGAVPAWSPAENLPLTTKVRKDLEEPIKVKSNAGLVVAPWSKAYVVSSVRGIAISPAFPRTLIDGNAPAGWFPTDDPTLLTNYLLVCDLAISTVHVFDLTTGERLFGITVPSPVQVVFPQRYSEPRRVNGTLSYFDVPYIYVTSKKDGMAYMVRFVSPSVGIPGSMVARQAGTSPHQLHHFRLTSPITMHALSGVYEYASRDVLYIADRNGRRIGTYASPFIMNDYKTSRGPTAYLGDFIHDLPDQPEFVMAVLLENQQNIPFCYELTVSGSLRYTALCYAGHFWMVLATALAIIIPAIICCRQACFMARNSRKAAPSRETSTSHDLGETLSLLGRTARNYGSTNERSGGDARSAKND